MTEQEARIKYLASGGHVCPFCGSKEITAGETDSQDNGIYQNVACDNCNKTWADDYTLTGVTFDDDAFPVPLTDKRIRNLVSRGIKTGISNTEIADWVMPKPRPDGVGETIELLVDMIRSDHLGRCDENAT